uniref:Uncharacterized protein LOC113789489 n=1 Tax=Dermatophagoides pteronyssinus TaxID=6956 RepID=A0A6P6XPP1_DERPT|nr:uncharacterized protein LOC113789489 [Dermatophagoides pteronyssinus]
MEFDPSKYSTTSFDSMGPALKLIHLIKKQIFDINQPLRIVDLGCGPGNSSCLLAESFPQSTIIGLDVVPEMIEHAKKNFSKKNDRFQFFVQDLGLPFDKWNTELRELLQTKQVDLIFSNYALQWIFNPSILGDSLRKILKPKTGILVANILFSDILSVVDQNDQHECKLLEKYLHYPSEKQFISEWIFGLKNDAHLNDIWLHYWQPKCIYPEKYYRESYVKIPLKWHEHFIDNSVSEELRKEILKILTKLILKKRITRIIPRRMNGLNHHHNDVNQVKNGDANDDDDDEMNDIEIEQQLWTVVARSSNDNFV